MKKEEIQLSAAFKTQAAQAIFSIGVFILTYLIILILAVLLTGACILGGGALIIFKPALITIVLGVGMASFGILILIFLIKFIFKSHKTDRSHLIEIKESQQPELFKLIREIVLEVGTNFPKKVYLSSEVNASVFYDSSFWSMFLPVKKNLQIGLGLVNTITREELKAILSHEFGHFSQRTMKVGSYVYNVNQIIFNMLFDNESYEKLIQKWGNTSGYFSIFVVLAVKVNEGIQWILRKLYELVNKSYMGLSREMEFHADEIAASITGYEPLKKSLLRMTLADNSFEGVLNFYNKKISENLKTDNIYRDQIAAFHFLAEINHLPVANGFPDISLEEQNKFDKSKLVIKNQWASHPSMEDRVKRLEQTGYSRTQETGAPANEVFSNIEILQKQLTQKIFDSVSYQGNTQDISTDSFIEEYKQEIRSNSFDEMYNRYYDHKNPVFFDVNENSLADRQIQLQDLFSDEKVDWVYTAIALQNDIETLTNIANNTIPLKTFDYDGIKYKKANAGSLADKLKGELEVVIEKIKTNDVAIYHYFSRIENTQNGSKELKQLYSDFFEFDANFHFKYDIYVQLVNGLQFVSVTTPFEQITANFIRIKPLEEQLKKEIPLLLSDSVLVDDISIEIKDSLELYISKTWEYFGKVRYYDNNLNIFYSAIHNYSFLLFRKYFLMKKAMLEYQTKLAQK